MIMKTNYFLCVLLLFCAYSSYSQDTISKPISESAFNKNIMQDINFMVLGDNNVKQGFSYTLDEEKTELTISGSLLNKKTYILTTDGSFSVDDGAFVFDNKDGSKKGKLSMNLFIPISFLNRKYFPAVKNHDDSNLANRARIKNYLIANELPEKVLDTFRTLDAIMEALGLPRSSIIKKKSSFLEGSLEVQHNLKLIEKLNEKMIVDTINTKSIEEKAFKALIKYYQGPITSTQYKNFAEFINAINNGKKNKIRIEGKKVNDKMEYINYEVPDGLNIESLFKDYDKIVARAKNIDEEIDDLQIKNFSPIWTYESTSYVGFSPYYAREGLETYNADNTILEFSDRFKEQRGDLYGLSTSFNYVGYKNKGSLNGAFLVFRGLVTLGRGSNFSDFKKKEYVYNNVVDQIGLNDISEVQKKTGYYTKNNASYQYGFFQEYSFETYASLKNLGVFCKIGYSKNQALAKQDAIPFETGIMINLKSEKKNIVSVLLFVERENLHLHPDDDMNFGFKIGLPINIKKPNTDNEK
jgi:hypothetical protein